MFQLIELYQHLPLVIIVSSAILSFMSICHIALRVTNPNSAAGWAAFSLFVPFLGPVAYWALGINRVQRKARKLYPPLNRTKLSARSDEFELPKDKQYFSQMISLVGQVTQRPLHSGNTIEPLVNGDPAYSSMLESIRLSTETISLSAYIFEHDSVGLKFVKQLKAAKDRGVDVRIIIDSMGARHSFPSIFGPIKKAGLKVRSFNPTLLPWSFHYSQLRNHRKILVVDGSIAFIGGMNISEGNLLISRAKRNSRTDVHYKLTGPAIRGIQEVFSEDWQFCGGKELANHWFRAQPEQGMIAARRIADGPDADFRKIQWVLLGAISTAVKSIHIVTPYFIPDDSLINALAVASMRGLKVQIITPEIPDVNLVSWARTKVLQELLDKNCEIYFSKPPFDHSKIFVVDEYWTLVTSANWDARSLRLNFEIGLECYDKTFAKSNLDIFNEKLKNSNRVNCDYFITMPLVKRLRNGFVNFLTPYL